MPRWPKTPEQRFWDNVQKGPRCWEWKGGLDARGYGDFTIGTKKVKPHRFAWMLRHGKISSKIFVCHHCDNKKCVKTKPDKKYPHGHLFLGTCADNAADAAVKGILKKEKCRNGHPYLPDNQVLYRDKRKFSGFARYCRKCLRAAFNRRWKRKKGDPARHAALNAYRRRKYHEARIGRLA